jgi:hypothetical protein
LASLHWKRRRLNVGSLLAYQKQPEADAMAEAAKEGWRGVAEYLATSLDNSASDEIRAVTREHHKGIEHLANLIIKHSPEANSDVADEAKEQSKLAILEKLIALTRVYSSIGKDSILPMFRLIEGRELDQKVAERAYRPDIMEKEMKLHAEIDRRIEKAMRAFVLAREIKKQYATKTVGMKQLAASANATHESDGSLADNQKPKLSS